jgi:hypothetical protein
MRPRRKAIPNVIKCAVIERQRGWCPECGISLYPPVQYDHRPALIMRSVLRGDYVPPQLDPTFIEAVHAACHQKRTTGRAIGAAKTVTTKGSDAWLAAKFRKLEGKNKPKRKAKIASRGFPKQQRGFR